MTGGLSQQRIQERITNAVSNHVRDVARRLEEIVFGEDIGRIVLGGDEIMLTEFKNHLSERAWERVVTMDRLDIRLPADQAVARALEAVTTVEQDEARDIARFTLQDTLADGLGVAGERAVKSALEQGAVDTLVLDPNFGTEERREALTELALQMGGRVEFVQNSQEIARMSGVAARLRWRPDGLPSSPVADETTAKQEAAAVA
jgi:peptide subunit release factor 1 (eRF1)